MQLYLRIIQDAATGRGVIEILEQRTITCRARIGLITYDNEEQKKFFVEALLEGGKYGSVIPLSK
ncbi:MAG: hypothetical protein H5T41_00475 [Methanomassiliicoccales archaeon]|jgi:hypothetical protein|nr:hypothetical protein [Methanomassiliicoccales archaeon]